MDSDARTPPPSALPMWIPTPAGQAYAWLHLPGGQLSRDTAVLLCDPFGNDRMNLHATYRELALRLAQAGFPVLRIDYPGTCDAEGWPRRSCRVERWLECLEVGADRLLAWSGARQLALFGAMLGGTLAALLAGRRSDVDGLVLWAPHLRGRAAVREYLAYTAACASNPAETPPSTARPGDRESLGFLMTASFIEDLRGIDLLARPGAVAQRACLFARTEVSGEKRLADHLAKAGLEVEFQPEPVDDLMPILESGGVELPERLLQMAVDWFTRAYPDRVLAAARPAPESLCPPQALLPSGVDQPVRETALQLGSDHQVFGILTEPAQGPARELGIVFVNGGTNHRPGINRNSTEWARQLAGRGHRVLRIDIRGLGDSPPRVPELRGVLYRDETKRDVLDAVAFLCEERGCRGVVGVGLCAGGFQALQAARIERRVVGVVLLNPLRFLEARHDVLAIASRERALLRRLKGRTLPWREAVRRLPLLAAALLARLFPPFSSVRPDALRLRRVLRALVARDVDLLVIYHRNEQALTQFESALGRARNLLAASGRFRIELVGDSDHIFSPLWIQEAVGRLLIRHFDRVSTPSPPADP